MPTADDGRAWPRWLLPAMVAGGGSLVGLIGIIVAIAVLVSEPSSPEPFGEPLDFAPAAGARSVEPAAIPTGVVVDVAGAVVRPGLHRLEAGARVGDAIEAAGGFAPRADLVAASQTLNLAQSLEDGAKVLVPELGTVRLDAPAAGGEARIDLNHADRAALESLPGIGPVTAGKIIEARKEQRFGAVRDLRSRGLVGESVFADIKHLVSAG